MFLFLCDSLIAWLNDLKRVGGIFVNITQAGSIIIYRLILPIIYSSNPHLNLPTFFFLFQACLIFIQDNSKSKSFFYCANILFNDKALKILTLPHLNSHTQTTWLQLPLNSVNFKGYYFLLKFSQKLHFSHCFKKSSAPPPHTAALFSSV